ncbi:MULTISPECIES: tol-pal system protein YbgF [unclassified Aureimonas]|uniref:tol-pal system protein YbgF n=1 Tax=unclassified Aureimonas TaxID=2615206 RepID=UPI000AE7B70B|nr:MULTISPECIES: tol-pal system protein YbgF [unclassified Aureimonas]
MALSARWTAAAAMLLAITAPASALNLPFGLGQETARPAPSREPAPVRMAQASDAGQRVMQLEEENRRLNGKVEELSFQMLQIQEQMRKMQEDNDFRFQELEGAASAGGGAGKKRSEAAPATAAPGTAASAAPGSGDAEYSAAAPSSTATPPAAGGDEIGSLLGGGQLDVGSISSAPAAPSSGSGTVASVLPKGAGDLYALAYNYLLAGDYQLAENSFRQYAQTYPDAKDVPDAQYWLGESLFAQAKYADAAETFLNAQKAHPKSGKAPEMMLKLGMSLSKLDNRETACVTFKEVARRYPQMSANVKRKLDAETKATSC